MKKENVRAFEEALEIDPDKLDECLIEQPALFYHVANGHRKAVSARDRLKLELADLCADLDQALRREADNREEKVTEKIIEQRLRLLPKVKDLNLRLSLAQADVDHWVALKEAFLQRSYMLKELVAWKLGELQALSIERGAGSSRTTLRDGRAEYVQGLRRVRS